MSVLLLTKARELAKKCNDERQVHGSSAPWQVRRIRTHIKENPGTYKTNDVGAEPAILGAADGPVLGR
jgi:hypothetical protein